MTTSRDDEQITRARRLKAHVDESASHLSECDVMHAGHTRERIQVRAHADDVALLRQYRQVFRDAVADDEDAITPRPPAISREADAGIARRDCR